MIALLQLSSWDAGMRERRSGKTFSNHPAERVRVRARATASPSTSSASAGAGASRGRGKSEASTGPVGITCQMMPLTTRFSPSSTPAFVKQRPFAGRCALNLSVLSICLHLTFLPLPSKASLSLRTDFDREFLASPGTSRFFTCTPVDTEGTEGPFLKELRWTWNSTPLLIYDFIKNHNWFPASFPDGVNVNADLSGRDRIGLQNLSQRTNGVLTCEIVDVFGHSVTRSTLIRILASPPVTKLAEDAATLAPLLPGALDGHLQDASQDADHVSGGGSRRSRLRVSISSDGHPSQADSRILKAKDGVSSSICLTASPFLILCFILLFSCLVR